MNNSIRDSVKALLTVLILGAATFSRAAGPEVVATGLRFPEGPVFVGGALYLVDYSTSEVLRLVGHQVDRVWHQEGCGANGLTAATEGLFVACYDSGSVVRISFDGRTEETLTHDDSGHPFVCPNDLAADARGGIYFSASGSGSTPGKLFYRSPDGHVREVASNLRYANGLVVSLDGKTLYVAESAVSRLVEYPIETDGSLGAQREFVRLGDILPDADRKVFTPDGVRIDRNGNLFIGLYRGGGFAVVSREGRLVKYVGVAGAHYASLALSPDGQRVLLTSSEDEVEGTYRGQVLSVPNPLAQ